MILSGTDVLADEDHSGHSLNLCLALQRADLLQNPVLNVCLILTDHSLVCLASLDPRTPVNYTPSAPSHTIPGDNAVDVTAVVIYLP